MCLSYEVQRSTQTLLVYMGDTDTNYFQCQKIFLYVVPTAESYTSACPRSRIKFDIQGLHHLSMNGSER